MSASTSKQGPIRWIFPCTLLCRAPYRVPGISDCLVMAQFLQGPQARQSSEVSSFRAPHCLSLLVTGLCASRSLHTSGTAHLPSRQLPLCTLARLLPACWLPAP